MVVGSDVGMYVLGEADGELVDGVLLLQKVGTDDYFETSAMLSDG